MPGMLCCEKSKCIWIILKQPLGIKSSFLLPCGLNPQSHGYLRPHVCSKTSHSLTFPVMLNLNICLFYLFGLIFLPVLSTFGVLYQIIPTKVV